MNFSPTMLPRRRTVLLVDDSAHVRRNLAMLLGWSGEWQVVGEAGNAADALDIAASLHPDLVLLDVWLCDKNSLDLLPQLHELQPRPQVIMLARELTESVQHQAMALGATGCIEKTQSPTDLLVELSQ